MDTYLRDPIMMVIAILAAAVFGLAIAVWRLSRKWNAVFERDPIDATGGLGEALRRLTTAEHQLASFVPRLEILERIGERAFQKLGFTRYNAFPGTGGEQSFVVAMLDRENSGIVISSLYGREGTRIYGKRIEKGAPLQPLSEEEEAALREALTRMTAPHDH